MENILEAAVESEEELDEGDFGIDDFDKDSLLEDPPGKRTRKDSTEEELDDFSFENIE